jgi:type IV secretory pathway ATPase VirB11/archaellum biosynthesis ATPase
MGQSPFIRFFGVREIILMSAPKGPKKSGDKFWDLVRKACKKSVRRRPGFTSAWIRDVSLVEPRDSRENVYTKIEIHSNRGGSERCYVLTPAEFGLDHSSLEKIMESISSLESEPPPSSVMDDEARLRRYVERRVMRELKKNPSGKNFSSDQVLSRICGQYTIGLGVLEHLLRDERVQDIYVDPPLSTNPVHLTLGGMTDPELEGSYPTNVILTEEEVERIVSILRYTSGRPFSEANPVLECDMPIFNSRVTAVSPPLSPGGISLAIRKHSHDPWTLLRLISSGSITPRAAAFLDLCIDGRSTMLIAGPRGAGKSSLLGALLFNVDPSRRIITIEDTPELPVRHLTEEGFNVLGLTVEGDGKQSTDKALRTALRLGESVLVMGEVRGPETRTLYEAMSAGTAGSAVLGTFHGDSAESVYKRTVEDLGVSPGSFSSTDLVIVCGLVQPKGRRTRYRRVIQISEYIKKGKPGRFRDLFRFDSDAGALVMDDDISSSETFSKIASIWGMSLKELLSELDVRTRVLEQAGDILDESEIEKPSSMVKVLNALRDAREELGTDEEPEFGIIGKWKKKMSFEEEAWEI